MKVSTREFTGLEKDPYQLLWDGIPIQEGYYFLSSSEEWEQLDDHHNQISQLLRLERDPKVAAVLGIRVNGTINRPCKVLPGGDRDNDLEAANFVKSQLLGIEEFPQSGILDEFSAAMLSSGILGGYAIAEVLWQPGDWTEIREIRVRSPERFVFWRPPSGDISEDSASHWGFEVRQRTTGNPWRGSGLPAKKILVYTFGSRTHNPFGFGVGNRIWWSVKLKRDLLYDWMRYCGTFAQPTIVGKVDPENENGRLLPEEYEIQQRELFRFLQAIRNGTIGVLPENGNVSFLEAMRAGGEATYKTLYDIFDREISEVVLGNLNHGESQGLSGAPAKNDEEIRLEVAKADADTFHSQTVNGQLVKWLVDLNRHKLGDAVYPQIWRDFSVEENKTEQLGRIKTLFDMGFRLSLDAVHQRFGEDYVDIMPPPEPTPGFNESTYSYGKSRQEPPTVETWISRAAELVTPWYRLKLNKIRDVIAGARERDDDTDQVKSDIFGLQSSAGTAPIFSQALYAAYLAGLWEAQHETAIVEYADPENPYTMEFSEAISWLEGKVLLPTATRQRLSAEWANHAFWISGITDAQLLSEMFDALLETISEGEGFAEFEAKFTEVADRRGWQPREGIAPRAKIVFDANFRTAFAAGQFAQYTKPHILSAFPEWEWRHRDSLHPRPHHLAMDGKRFEASEKPPFWLPSGFGCRCRFIPRRSSGDPLVKVKMVQNPKGIKGELSPSVTIKGKREFLADPGWGAPPSTLERQKTINSMLATLPSELALGLQEEQQL